MNQRRDPWAPFRFWVALTIGVFALRAVALTSPLAPLRALGAIPGWVLLLLVLAALLFAAAALLFPGRVEPWREGEAGLWAEITADWRHGWRRLGSRRSGAGPDAAQRVGVQAQAGAAGNGSGADRASPRRRR